MLQTILSLMKRIALEISVRPLLLFLAFHAARCHKRTIELIDRIYHVIFTCSFPAPGFMRYKVLDGQEC